MADQPTDKSGYALIKLYVCNIHENATSKDNKKSQCAVLSLHKTLDSAVIAQNKEIEQYGDTYRLEKRGNVISVYDYTKVATLLSYSRSNKHLFDYCIVKVGERLEG